METQMSGWECKFDMRAVLIGNLRTILSLDRVTEDSIKKRLACVQFFNASSTHFSFYPPKYFTHTSASIESEPASCFPVVSA